eukprot:2091389-Ditylum_brightwellii.AAC.1
MEQNSWRSINVHSFHVEESGFPCIGQFNMGIWLSSCPGLFDTISGWSHFPSNAAMSETWVTLR